MGNIWTAKAGIAELIETLRQQRSLKELEHFLIDLMTQTELEECARRWKAAQMLHQGKSYVEIIKQTRLSSTTVARVAACLKEGEGGYRRFLDRQSSTVEMNHRGESKTKG